MFRNDTYRGPVALRQAKTIPVCIIVEKYCGVIRYGVPGSLYNKNCTVVLYRYLFYLWHMTAVTGFLTVCQLVLLEQSFFLPSRELKAISDYF